MNITTKSASSNATTTITDFLAHHAPECAPFVRYGYVKEDGTPYQKYELYAITDPVPEDAKTASALYFLTNRQQARLEDQWGRRYTDTNIAKELQSECERDDRVLYPVLAESDEGDNNVSIETMTAWLETFVTDYLGVPAEDCAFFDSGNRSVHVHVPRFVTHANHELVKVAADRYCEETDAILDTGVYKPKQLFRLPGVTHHKTTRPKTRFNPAEGRQGLVDAIKAGVKVPATFVDVLAPIYDPYLDCEGGPFLTISTPRPNVAVPLIERRTPPTTEGECNRWDAYNRKEFSPYAHARKGNGRSVAAIRVVGSPFAREERKVGNSPRPIYALLPVYFYGAHGCNGREFRKYREYAPLQLSKKDYEKRPYEQGDVLVVIGGGNGSSLIHDVDTATGVAVGKLLGPDGSRDDALAFLTREGYEIGSSGASTPSRRSPAGKTNLKALDRVLPATNPHTNAGRLQQQVEQRGVHSLRNERAAMRLIGNRLLTKYSWEATWAWFKDQYGPTFNSEITHRELRNIANHYGIDVTIPRKNPGR